MTGTYVRADNVAVTDREAPEALARRLAEIVDELASLPEGPSPERYRLLTERDSLRARAAEAAIETDEARSIASLEAELASLRRQRRDLVRSRGGYITGDGADSAGRVGVSLTRLGAGAGGSDVDRLTVRISRIEDVLAARNDAPEI